MRVLLIPVGLALLVLAWSQTAKAPEAPDYAISLPQQSDATFWANHRGLDEVSLEGQVGFGEMARLLMRRRSNSPLIRPLREGFEYVTRDFREFRTPEMLRVVLSEKGLQWTHRPERMILTAGWAANLPLVVESRVPVAAKIKASVTGGVEPSDFTAPDLAPRTAGGYLLRLKSDRPGSTQARIAVSAAGIGQELLLPIEVRAKATLKVNLEDESGEPAAARVYLTASDGLAYAPKGAVNRIAAESAESYFYAGGSFTVDVPSGPAVIEATRGLEYSLAKREIVLKPGENPPVRMRLQRWASMSREGWYSADSHIHANYVAPHHQTITPEDVRLQAEAEDLNLANLLLANSYTDFVHDEKFFEGRPHALSKPNHILYWNEEMRGGSSFGHMCFFALKSLVEPLFTGQPGGRHWEDYPPNYTQAKQAREQGGAVTYAHPSYLPGLGQSNARELPVDLALGEVDAMDVLSNSYETAATQLYHRLLNCGFRLTASAGTDSFTNLVDHYVPGGGRVYVRVNGKFDSSSWVEGFKAGRSFVSNGPVVFLNVQGHGPGEELRLPTGWSGAVDVRVTVKSQVPIDTIEILVNGKPALSQQLKGRPAVTLRQSIPLRRSSWIAARVTGPWSRLILNDAGAFAHTTPVYVMIGDEPIAAREDLRFFIDWIEQLIAKVRRQGKFADAERRDEVVKLFEKALEVYRRRAAAQ